MSAILERIARAWPVTAGTATDNSDRTYAVERCGKCGGAILPPGIPGRIGHLTAEHGYRADGRRWTNVNELIPGEEED